MNTRIEKIAKELQAYCLDNEQKPGFNPYENDVYYLMVKLEKAYQALEIINNARITQNNLISLLDELKAD